MAVTKASGHSASHKILSDFYRAAPDTPLIHLGNSRVSSVLLTCLVKSAHWLICLQQHVIDGTKAVEELLIEARQTVKEAPGTVGASLGKCCWDQAKAPWLKRLGPILA